MTQGFPDSQASISGFLSANDTRAYIQKDEHDFDSGIAEDYLDPAELAAADFRDYLSAKDWRAPTPQEYQLRDMAANGKHLSVGKRVIADIIANSDHMIMPDVDALLSYIAEEDSILETIGLTNHMEELAAANDRLVDLRQKYPELQVAGSIARRNVAIFGVYALTGVDLSFDK